MKDVFLQSFIDVDLWNAARWRGTAFLHEPSGEEPPGLGFLFENIEAGKQIFSEWHERVGRIDEYEEIRLSIIRGEILGLEAGYSIHVSSNPSHSIERANAAGKHLDVQTAVIVSRVHRMNPEIGVPHLPQFEKDYAAHRHYFLVPVSLSGIPELQLSIEKHEIHFRQAADIRAHDVDAVVFPENYFVNDKRVH